MKRKGKGKGKERKKKRKRKRERESKGIKVKDMQIDKITTNNDGEKIGKFGPKNLFLFFNWSIKSIYSYNTILMSYIF